MTIVGIDASRWQGKLPVYEIEESGVEFVILKACHGASKNPDGEFRGNWERLSNTSMLKGAYTWFTDADPVLQAEAFIRAVDRVHECDLPLAIDFEEPSTVYRGNALCDRLRVMISRVMELSGQPKLLLYSGKWYIDQYVGDADMSDLVEATYYWHAEYPRAVLADHRRCGTLPPALGRPTLPKPWQRAAVFETLWQFDGDGGCVLPNGVDADYNLFRGTRAELGALLPRFGMVDTLPAPAPEPIAIERAEDFVKKLADD